MTTAVKMPETREQFEAHALALAFDRQLVGTARVEAEYPSGVRQYRVPSADRRGHGHLVTVSGDVVTCDCPAGAYHVACSHAGAAIHYERQRAAARRGSESDCAWTWWADGGEW